MARIDTFQNWATDVAESIRTKTGKTDKIPASSFDTEIAGIQTKEDLDAELTVQNNEITKHETSIQDILSVLEGKAGNGKYAPRFISFFSYDGTDLNYELKNLDMSNITSMTYMFRSCSNITDIDLSHFDTSNITSMNSMFSYCSSLTKLDLRNFNTNNVKDMTSMFEGCTNLTYLDLSSFIATNSTQFTSMFYNCTNLKYLDIRNFNVNDSISPYRMFDKVPKDCEIIVKDNYARALVQKWGMTNVKTVAELEVS